MRKRDEDEEKRRQLLFDLGEERARWLAGLASRDGRPRLRRDLWPELLKWHQARRGRRMTEEELDALAERVGYTRLTVIDGGRRLRVGGKPIGKLAVVGRKDFVERAH